VTLNLGSLSDLDSNSQGRPINARRDPREWTPRELRHSFVSLLSDAGVSIEQISRLVGHSGTTATETVYRKQIRPVIVQGADAMDRIFPAEAERA
jgi:integrase